MLSEDQTSIPKETSETVNLVLAEYHTLRDEILKRIELQQQVLSLALIVPGTIAAFGLQTKNAAIILLYPLFALFLAAIWAHHDRKIRQMGAYINVSSV